MKNYKILVCIISILLILSVILLPVLANTKEEARKHDVRGYELLNAGDYDGAIKEFSQAIDLGLDDYCVNYQLGRIYEVYKNNPSKARIYYEKYLNLDPKGNLAEGGPAVESALYVGNIYFDEQDYSKAVEFYKISCSIRGAGYGAAICCAHYKLGLCYIKINKLDLAQKEFKIAIQCCDSELKQGNKSDIIKECKTKSQIALEYIPLNRIKSPDEDTLAGISLKDNSSKVIELIGKPYASRGGNNRNDFGINLLTYQYNNVGIFIAFCDYKVKNTWTVFSICVNEPCTLGTSRGITIGSSESDVRKNYLIKTNSKPDDRKLNKIMNDSTESWANKTVYCGDDYYGELIAFKFDENSKVSGIALGVINNSNNQSNIPEYVPTPTSHARENLLWKDFPIASLQLGYSLAQVKKVYPDIKFIKTEVDRMSGTDAAIYGKDGLRLYFLNLGKGVELCSIKVTSDKYPTARGIKVGNSVEKVIGAYGEAKSTQGPYMYYDDAPYICFTIDTDKMVVKMITISYGD